MLAVARIFPVPSPHASKPTFFCALIVPARSSGLRSAERNRDVSWALIPLPGAKIEGISV